MNVDRLVDFLIKTNDWVGKSKEINDLITNLSSQQILDALDKASKIRDRLSQTPLGRELS